MYTEINHHMFKLIHIQFIYLLNFFNGNKVCNTVLSKFKFKV